MSRNPWGEFARRSRKLYEQQTELTKTWLDGQAKLSGTFAKAGQDEAQTGMDADAAAMAELWRSWLGLSGSLGTAMPGMTEPPGRSPARRLVGSWIRCRWCWPAAARSARRSAR